MVSSIRKRLDLDQIWKNQKLSPALEAQLLLIAESVNEQIQDAPELITNVTEWCKKEACWQRIKDSQQVTLNQDLIIELLDVQEVIDRAKDAEKTQTIDNGIFSQKYVIEKDNYYNPSFYIEYKLFSNKPNNYIYFVPIIIQITKKLLISLLPKIIPIELISIIYEYVGKYEYVQKTEILGEQFCKHCIFKT